MYDYNKNAITTKRIYGSHEYKRFCLFMTALLCFVLCISFSMNVKAAAFDYNAWLLSEQTKYPAGKYWNHAGKDNDNSDGYTDTPCSLHGVSGVDHIYGTGGCTCNHFADPGISGTATYPAVWHYSASQCMGFANKLGYDMFGSTMWSRITTASDPNYAANVRVGDIVRINGHSTFVISKSSDNTITVGECNYVQRSSGQGCLIAWGRAIDLSKATSFEYYERAQNYDGVIAGTITPAQDTTEQKTTETSTTEKDAKEIITDENGEPYTGWRLAEDGEHYLYIKKGEVVADKWVTVRKKKYYLDDNGFRATGLFVIGKKKYYFNEDGVLQKNKWITEDSNTYYIGAAGHALKSQWLYKGKYLVYVKDDCVMAKSELVKISGSTYFFNSKGRRSAGFKKCNGKYYYCNSNGIILKKQWITKGTKKYYVNKSGVRVQNKIIKIFGSRYYFNNKGLLQKNKEIEYAGKVYKADANGRLKYVRDVEVTSEEETTLE